jgi:hypothetical protein
MMFVGKAGTGVRISPALWVAMFMLMLPPAFGGTAGAETCPQQPVLPAGSKVPADGWQSVDGGEGVCVYNRRVPGSPIRAVMARAVIDAAPQRAFAVIGDYAHYADFMPYVSDSRVLTDTGATRRVFLALDFPLFISDRYSTIELSEAGGQPGQAVHRIEWTLAAQAEAVSPGAGGEPLRVNDGVWELRPLDGGRRTDVLYYVHTDPGGYLPTWVVELANNVAVPRVVEAVQQRAAQ